MKWLVGVSDSRGPGSQGCREEGHEGSVGPSALESPAGSPRARTKGSASCKCPPTTSLPVPCNPGLSGGGRGSPLVSSCPPPRCPAAPRPPVEKREGRGAQAGVGGPPGGLTAWGERSLWGGLAATCRVSRAHKGCWGAAGVRVPGPPAHRDAGATAGHLPTIRSASGGVAPWCHGLTQPSLGAGHRCVRG